MSRLLVPVALLAFAVVVFGSLGALVSSPATVDGLFWFFLGAAVSGFFATAAWIRFTADLRRYRDEEGRG